MRKTKTRSESSIQQGVIESLLVIPLFLLLAWGAAFVSLLLLEKSRLEQSTWVYGMSRSNRAKKSKALKNARLVYHELPNPALLQAKEKKSCEYELATTQATLSSLPVVFVSALLSNCSATVHLTSQKTSKVFEAYFDSSTKFTFQTKQNIPGNDFKNSWALKQSLWQKSMLDAGFGILPLQALGVPELLKAASLVGFGALGSSADRVLTSQATSH